MPLYPIITNFTGGEISHRFEGRIDLKGYYNSCRILENFIVHPSGGVMKAPGSYYVAEVKDSSKKVVLIIFEAGPSETYVLEFGTDYFRVYQQSTHSQITEVSLPFAFAEEELPEIQYAQSENTMYLVHTAHHPLKITYSGGTWSVSQPQFKQDTTPDRFAAAGDYPGAVTFYQQRLILAGSDNDPQTVWGSKPDSYEDISLGSSTAGDGFEFSVAMNKSQKIMWLAANRFDIFFGTNLSEWKITSQGGSVNPTDFQFVKYSTYGSANRQAVLVNSDLFFMQRAKKKIRNYVYSNEIGGYRSLDLTFKADHITEPNITEVDLQQEPYTVLWGVRSDGQLVALVYDIDNNIIAWSRRVTEGEFESLAVTTQNGEDELWVVVKRNINGTDKRYIEYFAPIDFDEQNEAHYVDCGIYTDLGDSKDISNITQAKPAVVTITSHGYSDGQHVYINDVEGMTEINDRVYTVKNPTADTFELYSEDGTTQIDSTNFSAYTSGGYAIRKEKQFSGLSHLVGETVKIYADGAVQPEKTVDASGNVTLDYWSNKVHIGLGYEAQLQPMKIEIPMPLGTAQSRMKRINKVVVRFYKALGCKIGSDEDNLETLKFRTGSTPMGVAAEVFTGDKEAVFKGDFDKSGDILIKSDTPTPLGIVALMPVMKVY